MLAATIALMGLASGALAPPPVITNPDWERKPTAKEVSHFYPGRAAQLGYAGQATVSCTVLVDGHLADCKIVQEEPLDRGFGDAVLKLSETFLMKPQTRDGQPLSGGMVRIPILFMYPGARLAPLQATHPSLKEGHADLNCRVSESRLLENCFLETLKPSDAALKDTALRLAVRFRAPEGTPAGKRLVLPIDFHTGSAPALAPTP